MQLQEVPSNSFGKWVSYSFLLNAKVQRDLPLFGEKPWLHFRLFYGLGKVIQFYCRKWICLNGKEIASRIKAEKNVVLQENDKILEKKSNLFWIYFDWIVTGKQQLFTLGFIHKWRHYLKEKSMLMSLVKVHKINSKEGNV